MSAIETLINSLPGQWAIIALIAGIGLAVVFLRGLIRIAVRIFLIGAVGFILLAAVYLIFNYAHISL
jgi:high-affinity Fe2+/Pb2+ permease